MEGASCMLMRRAVRQTRVATGGQASEHRARTTWVYMLLCVCWRVTHLFLSLRTLPPAQIIKVGLVVGLPRLTLFHQISLFSGACVCVL